MSRYDDMFARLAQKKRIAFIPFVMLFDPDRETCKKIIGTLIEAGADALELGIAFSDPLADGPTIQKAGLRALKAGSTVRAALTLIKEIRDLDQNIPIGVLTYANLIFKHTPKWFYGFAKQCGVDSVLLADVPLMEAGEYCMSAVAHGIDPVLIAPINLPHQRCQDIARMGRGYTYVVTRKGVTGADQRIELKHRDLLQALRIYDAPKAVMGFGISTPEHVRIALGEGAHGVISGSKTVSIIEDHIDDKDRMLTELKNFVKGMVLATEHK